MIGVLAIIALIAGSASSPIIVLAQSTPVNYNCTVLYFFNGIVVYSSAVNETLYLETPRNISLVEAYEQRVHHILSFNLEYNDETGLYAFNVTEGGYFEGFFISRVEICAFYTSVNLVRLALKDPSHPDLALEGIVPEEIAANFTRTPHERVVASVKPAFEFWFSTNYLIHPQKATPVGLALAAGLYVQLIYITYDAGTTPRTIDEVIEQRKGDCDDMSRVLVELLNSYNIPAAIQSGYVYVKNFNYTIPVENVTYVFINSGPHAFTTAYVPGYGWISLDFLAGSLITSPFIFEGYRRETSVDKEAVESFLNLHKALNATQVMAVFEEEEVKQFIGETITLENVLRFFHTVLKGESEQRNETQTATVTLPDETPITESPANTVVTSTDENGFSATETPSTRKQSREALDITTVVLVTSLALMLVALLLVLRVMNKVERGR